MLGAIGFTSAALLFFWYGLSARNTNKLPSIRNQSYAGAYIFLALACVTWAITLIFGDNALDKGVLVGDLFVIIGTVLMIDSISKANYRAISTLGSLLLGIMAFIARIKYFSPNAYINDGILVFNSAKTVTVIFTAMFVLIWFPITMRFVREVLTASKLDYLVKAGVFSCVLAVFGVTGFVSSKKKSEVIAYFVILCSAYASLIGIAYLSRRGRINES